MPIYPNHPGIELEYLVTYGADETAQTYCDGYRQDCGRYSRLHDALTAAGWTYGTTGKRATGITVEANGSKLAEALGPGHLGQAITADDVIWITNDGTEISIN